MLAVLLAPAVAAVVLFVVPRPSQALLPLVGPAPRSVSRPVVPEVTKSLRAVPLGAMVEAANNKGVSITPPASLAPDAAPLRQGGRAEVLFMCNEYNGYCADVSWPLVLALDEFGTFHHLGYFQASGGFNPGTVGFDFYGTSYSSPYVAFDSVEMYDQRQVGPHRWQVLQRATAAQDRLLYRWDVPPYASPAYATPFVLFGGRYFEASPGFSGEGMSGLSSHSATTLAMLAQLVAGGRSLAYVDVRALAARMVGAICKVTGNLPPACQALPSALERFFTPTSFNQ